MSSMNKEEAINKNNEAKKTFSKGDRLIVDVNTYSPNGDLVDRFCVKNFELILGKNTFINNFDDKFLHNEIKPSYKFQVKIPKNDPSDIYKNQKFWFEVELKNYDEIMAKKSSNSNEETNLESAEKIDHLKDDPLVKAQAKILSLYAKSEMLARDNEFLKAQLERAKETPKTIVVPDEMKKQIHQYALQDFFEQFVNYYSLYKTTTLSSEKQAELLDDPKLKAFAKGYRMITWQFDELFKKYNFIEIKPIEGEIFNPEYQKVNDQFIDDEFPTNTIINVHSSAFMLHDRVLHVALVDTTVRSTDPQAKVLIEKLGDNAYHKTSGKLHTLEEKVSESIAKSNK